MNKLIPDIFFNQNYFKNPLYCNEFESLIKKVLKPARYIGIEPYSYHKNKSNQDSLLYKVAITYPDLYEIAMSNLTLKYFYDFINKKDNFVCERVFLPDKDLVELLLLKNLPLLSLESWTPIKNFDLWAFTLQTELDYTNILFLFKLAQLNPFVLNRAEEDPIVIVGGVSVFNPIPLSPFIDLFFLGEGEEKIIEILELDNKNKKNNLSRDQRIKSLLHIDGVFSFHEKIKNYYQNFIDKPKNKIIDRQSDDNLTLKFIKYLKDEIKIPDFSGIEVKRQIIKDLNKVKYPLQNILPLVQTVQDRLSCEVARGCLNGCRFCQASFVYRPYREKDSIDIALNLAKSLMITGHEECNLSSLSISDYSNIVSLMKAMEKYLSKKNVSLSVPSLRIASFDIELFNSLSSVRKSGLTFAVEAGSDCFRDKINKHFDEDKFIYIIQNLYLKGWKVVKLYFIMGFPDMEDEEEKIIEFLSKIKNNFPKLNVNASIALLIPKPYTPFSFDEQIPVLNFIEKVNKIKNKFRSSKISIKYHDPYSSFLEYFFANGAFDASYFLNLAYDENVCFDAWDEKKNNEFYRKFDIYSQKPILIKEKLDLAKIFEGEGFSNFLINEREKYDRSERTENCISAGCKSCFVCNDDKKNILSKKYDEDSILNELYKVEEIYLQGSNIIKTDDYKTYLLRFSKFGLYRYVGHLDFYRIFIRILRIGGIDFEYSNGFNPMPRVFFPFATSLGMESYDDILIFNCKNKILNYSQFCDIYNQFLPDGFRFDKINEIESIPKWRKSAKVKQYLQINFASDFESLNINDLRNQIQNILNEKQIQTSSIDIKLDYGNKSKGTILLTTSLNENQVNIIKLLNGFDNKICFDIFSKRKIHIEE